MKQLFITILSLSLSGTITGLVITATHTITEKYFSKRWNYYIWLLVIIQLLLPFHLSPAFGSRLNWQITLDQSTPATAGHQKILPSLSDLRQESATDVEIMHPDTELTNNDITNHNSSGKAQQSSTTITLVTTAAYIWLFGVVISLFAKLLNYFLYKIHIKKTCTRIYDTRFITPENTFCAQLHIRNVPAINESATVSSPMTIGLRKPQIILPSAFLNLSQLQLTLHHELVHVARKDLLYKWCYQILLCIHWFNPLLYLFGRQMNRDCELSCDEAILTKLTQNGRQLYGNILLDTAAFGINHRGNALSTTLLANRKDLKKRLDNILHYKKTTHLRLAISACTFSIMLALSACGTVRFSINDTDTSESGPNVAVYHSDNHADSSSPATESDKTATKENDSSTTISASMLSADAFIDNSSAPDRTSDAWKVYDDAKLLAGEDIQDNWNAYNYYMNDRHILHASSFVLYGSDSIIIAYADKELPVTIQSSFEIAEGKFKLVHVAPDNTIVTLNETGAKTTSTITLQKGRNVLKLVGQGARLKNLELDCSDLNESNFEKLFFSKEEEYADEVQSAAASGMLPDKQKFIDTMIYLDAADVSEIFNALLSAGTTFTDEELCGIFIYSDSALSGQYLLDAIKAGSAASPSAETVSELIPFLEGDYTPPHCSNPFPWRNFSISLRRILSI